MKQRSFSLVLATLAVVLILLSAGAAAAQQGGPATDGAAPTIDAGLTSPDGGGGPGPITTGFSYQGQLKSGSGLVNGTCDFQFSLWDQSGTGAPPTGGTQLGTTETQTSVSVSKGLFTTILNSGNQFTDLAFQTARWLQIAVRCPAGSSSYTTLSPRQSLWAAPYAQGLRPGTMIKGSAYQNLKVLSTAPTGGIPAGVTGEITAAADGVGVYGSNSVAAAGATGVGVWGRTWSPLGAGVQGTGINGADGVYGSSGEGTGVYGQGEVGVEGAGTAGGSGTGVLGRGESYGEGVWGRNTTGVAGRFDTNSSTTTPQVLLKENANDFARLSFANTATDKTWTIAGYPSATDANARLNLWYSPIGDVMSLTGSGKVGIGTSDPKQKLHVAGDTYAKGHVWLYAYEGDGSTGTAYVQARDDSGKSSIGMQLRTQNAGTITEAVRVTPNGNVGIGTTAPAAQLHVESSASGGLGLFVKPGPGGKAAKFAGNVQLTDASGAYLVMELGQGLDYAEAFDVTGLDRPTPGTVLVIDSEHPGQLVVSSSPYDSKVAGIVAGAGGTGSGVRLGVGQYDTDVALAGRVYCNVDAGTEAIQPGDLLTTSARPGYAMKASDYGRTAGAILGKAMEPLAKGQSGLILVLVTLQ